MSFITRAAQRGDRKALQILLDRDPNWLQSEPCITMDLLKNLHKLGFDDKLPKAINHANEETGRTALHDLMDSASSDITGDLLFLLNHGGDVMKHGPKDPNSGVNILPVHIAASFQFKGAKDGESKLTQYLQGLQEFGLENLLDGQSDVEEFITAHLIPSVFCELPDFVNYLLYRMAKLPMESQEKILHFAILPQSADQDSGLDWKMFSRKAISWANRNKTTNSIIEALAKADRRVHDGIGDADSMVCFKLLPTTPLTSLAINAYQGYKPSKGFYSAVFSALWSVVVMHFGLFAFDLYLDIGITRNYKAQYYNATNTNPSSIIPISEYFTKGYLRYFYIFSSILISSSFLFYLIACCKHPSRPERCNIFIFPLIFPFYYFHCRVEYLTDPSNQEKASRYKDCVDTWNLVRRAELGIEATWQNMLQLHALFPVMKKIFELDGIQLIQRIWNGFLSIIPMFRSDQEFLDILLAKFVLSAATMSWSIAQMRTEKSPSLGFGAKMCFFAPTFLQIISRLMTLGILYFQGLHVLTANAFVAIHIIIVGLFEWPPNTTRRAISRVKVMYLISGMGSFLVYINVDRSEASLHYENNLYKKTFLPTFCHFCLYFYEHILACVFVTDVPTTAYFIPPILMAVSILLLSCYYKFLHPRAKMNGPSRKALFLQELREIWPEWADKELSSRFQAFKEWGMGLMKCQRTADSTTSMEMKPMGSDAIKQDDDAIDQDEPAISSPLLQTHGQQQQQHQKQQPVKMSLEDGHNIAQSRLLSIGFEVSPTQRSTPADGDCFIHGILDQIKYDPSSKQMKMDHTEFRKRVCDSAKAVITSGRIVWGEQETIEAWTAKMRNRGEYVDEVFIRLAAEYLQRKIIIHPVCEDDGHQGTGVIEVVPSVHRFEALFLLYYSEAKFISPHYQSIRRFKQ